ncbi:endonuclease VII domain-containing protein [Streptomyces olivaceoviridis]|uniref:endonuclease VII domain-containing protein n=1 Tax=Streptomyces olivaceoviridis TaxID=1921 RepID=UPI003696D06D
MQEALTPELARRCGYEKCEVDLAAVPNLKDSERYCSKKCRGRQHRLNRQRAAEGLTSKLCGGCREVLPIEKFTQASRYLCGACAKAAGREHYAKRNGADRSYAQCLKRNYGMTLKEYEERLAAQGGRCAICRDAPTKKRLHVDHNHETGAIRDLLCEWCNHAIGKAREDPARLRAMAEYLERHHQATE